MNRQFNPLDPLQSLRETPAGMRKYMAISVVGGLSIIIIGAYLTAIRHVGGVLTLFIGVIDTLLSFTIIPITWRRGKI